MDPDCLLPCYQTIQKKQSPQIASLQQLQLIFFDMDGVLTQTHSSWKHIHDYFGVSNDHSVHAYLNGEISDKEFIRRDISLWKENKQFITREKLLEILGKITLTPGAQELFSYLHQHKIKTCIISAGIDLLAKKVATKLHIPLVKANGVVFGQNHQLTGEGILQVRLKQKDEVIKKVAASQTVPLQHTASVGNSCFDIPMFETTALGIAFQPEDQCVRNAADFVIEEKDLTTLIPLLKPYIQ